MDVEYKSRTAAADQLSERYQELSGGVTSSGKNRNLSDEEYQEYLDISNQLIDLFPELYSYTDKNGNAITTLGNNASEAAAKIDKLAESYRKVFHEEEEKDFSKILKGNKISINAAQKDLSKYTPSDISLNENSGFFIDRRSAIPNGTGPVTDDDIKIRGSNVDYLLEIEKILKENGIQELSSLPGQKTGYTLNMEDYYLDVVGLSDDQYKKIKEQIEERTSGIFATYSSQVQSINENIASFQNNIKAGFLSQYFTSDSFAGLPEDTQNIVQDILDNLKFSETNMDMSSIDSMSQYVNDNILSLFSEDSPLDSNLQNRLISLFTMDRSDISADDIISLYQGVKNDITSALGEQDTATQIPILFDFLVADEEDAQNQLNERVNDLAKESVDKRDLNTFLSSEGIDTADEINSFLEITKEAKNAAEAMDLWNQAKEKAASNSLLTETPSEINAVKNAWEALNSADSGASSLVDAMTALNQAGVELDFSSIKSVDDLKQQLDGYTDTLWENVEALLANANATPELQAAFKNMIYSIPKDSGSLEDFTNHLGEVNSAFQTVQSAFQDYSQNGYISTDNLVSLLNLSDEYLAALIGENGQIRLNADSYIALASAQLDQAEAQAYQDAIASLNNFSDYANGTAELTEENMRLSASNYDAAASFTAYANARVNALGTVGINRTGVENTDKALQAKLALIGNARANLGKSFSTKNTKSPSSSSSKANTTTKQIDWIEYRIKELDDAIKLTQTHLNNLNGSGAKNILIDTLSNMYTAKQGDLQKSIKVYTDLANKELAKIPASLQNSVKNGAIGTTDFIGDNNDEVTKAIENYRKYNDKVAELTNTVAELEESLRKLEVDKFKNVANDFEKLIGLTDTYRDKTQDIIDLQEKYGNKVGVGFYDTMIAQTEQKKDQLQKEYKELTKRLQDSIASGKIKIGSEEWQEMRDVIDKVDSEILKCSSDIEDFANAKLEIKVKEFEEIQNAIDGIQGSLDTYISLLDSDTLTTGTTDLKFTDEALSQMGLLQDSYEAAAEKVLLYKQRMGELEQSFLAGELSESEYREQLNALVDAQNESAVAMHDSREAIYDLIKNGIDEVCDAIDDETKAYQDLIDKKKEALQQDKEEADFQKDVADKQKAIFDIQRQIAALGDADDNESVGRRKKLTSELTDAQEELDELYQDHNYDMQIDALDKESEAYEAAQEQRKETLQNSLIDREAIIDQYLQEVAANHETVYQTLESLGTQYGINIESAISDPWKTGENALGQYAISLGGQTSLFTEQLRGVESEIYNVQIEANNAAGAMIDAMGVSSDGLVSEITDVSNGLLTDTGYAQGLGNMLSSVLNANYNTSGITGSIYSIRNAADAAASSLGAMWDAYSGDRGHFRAVYQGPGGYDSKLFTSRSEALRWIDQQNAGIPNGSSKWIFREYAKGGLVTKEKDNPLNAIAKSVGEDTMIAAKEGEIVLDPGSAKKFSELVRLLRYSPQSSLLSAVNNRTWSNPPSFNNSASSLGAVTITNELNVNGSIDNDNLKSVQRQIDASIQKYTKQLLSKIRY